MTESCVTVQVACQNFSRRGKFLANESQSEKPSPHGVFRILDLRLFWACTLHHLCHLAQCKAKLDVAFQLSGVKPALALAIRIGELEASEFDGTVGEASVVIQHSVSAVVVMGISVFVAVVGVPDVRQIFHSLRLAAVQPSKEIWVNCPAVVADAVAVKPEGRNQKALMACHDVCQIPQAVRRVVIQSNVDVDSAHMGWVAFCTLVPELAEDFLQVLDVIVAEDWRSHLGSFIIVLCLNAGIPRDFPCATLVVFATPSLVSSAKVANRVFGVEVGGDGLASLLPCDVVHLHLNADGLLFHFFNLGSGLFVHNMYRPLRVCFPFR